MLNPIVYNKNHGYGDFLGYAERDYNNPYDTFITVRWDSGETSTIDIDLCEFIDSWFDMVL